MMVENIQNYYNKARNYMFANLEGIVGGKELEDTVKRYKKNYKSHRRPGMDD